MNDFIYLCVFLILVLFMSLMAGCATYSYCSPNKECVEISRFMSSEEFSSVEAESQSGQKLKVEGFKSDQTKALEITSEAILKAGAKAMTGGLVP